MTKHVGTDTVGVNHLTPSDTVREVSRWALAGISAVSALAAGASLVSRTEAGEWTTRVLQDPAGNEFCVIGPD